MQLPSKGSSLGWLFGLLLLLTFGNCSPGDQQEGQAIISYNYDIKPLLSDRCFACHGPDKNKREAELALHDPSLAFEALGENQDRFALVPGKVSKSEVYHRIISTDPELMMPPPSSHLSLTEEEKDLIARWIKQGAEYQAHWSFIPPKKTELPRLKDKEWPINEIDHFVLAELEEKELLPSAEASPATLLRRSSFAIRGLPPSADELERFLSMDEAEYYEVWIDYLLKSSAYGERMAAHWLDVARYADSDGYLDDKHRDFSPWRDWVIQSFNENLSYQDFITYQLAGDLLPNASQEQILATAFNRLHKKNSEAGIVFEEFRSEYVSDRTNTLGKAVLALSLECAKCHDHKYDPVSQADYFSLYAFFNSTNELGHAVYGPDQTPGPALLLMDEEMEEKTSYLKELHRKAETDLEILQKRELEHFAAWENNNKPSNKLVQDRMQKNLVAHYSFDQVQKLGDDRFSIINQHQPRQKGSLFRPKLGPGKRGDAFIIDDYGRGTLEKGVGLFEKHDPFSFDFWLYLDTLYEEAGVFLHCENLRLGYKGYSLHVKDNRLSFIMAHSWPQNAIQLTTQEALPTKKWTKVSFTYDGSSRAKGLRMYLDGREVVTEVDSDHLYKGILFEWNIHTYGFSGLTFGQRDKVKTLKGSAIDELKIYDAALSPLEILTAFNEGLANQELSVQGATAGKEFLQEFYLQRMTKAAQELMDSFYQIRQAQTELNNSIPEIMVMGDLPKPRPTYVLNRGNYDSPAEEVRPNTPSSILPFVEELPQNRLGLTQWLFDKKHPLTARVFVNRIWQLHFGVGLVKTTEDFGNQGALPSHPRLLDYLAVFFVESGWDIKALHKKILMSATYRQSSKIQEELHDLDPENIWLARGPRFKMPAEMVRDNALAISGLLVDKLGGESVYPYQPEGLWDEISNKGWRYPYLQKPGPGLYRRSVYSIWKRTSPPPSMLIFDVGNRDVCTVRRRSTDTPLQALVLLNDPQYQEASRKLAERVMLKEEGASSQLKQLFKLVFGRPPQATELQKVETYYEAEKTAFSLDKAKTRAYLAIGESSIDQRLDPAALSALSLCANALLNTYEGTIIQ